MPHVSKEKEDNEASEFDRELDRQNIKAVSAPENKVSVSEVF